MAVPFSYKRLEQKLAFYLKNNFNVLLEGHRGVGKTTIIEKVFNDVLGEGKSIYLSGSTLDPWVDFVGVPREVTTESGDHVLDFVLPRKFTDSNIEAIFIDEYNRSDKKVRNATMELIQFKSINGRKFPNLRVVWAAVNPFTDEEVEEGYDVEQIDAAQVDRFQIHIKLPYRPDLPYFTQKFGRDWAKSAIEWWNALSKEMQFKVSPRRLDYALEVAKIGGDVIDVIPLETNPAKLATGLVFGNIEDKLRDILKEGDYEKARDFINVENNYQSAKEFLEKDADLRRFFLPQLDEERLTSIFFDKAKIQNFIFTNPLFFKDFLEGILHADSCSKEIKQRIKLSLKTVEGMETF